MIRQGVFHPEHSLFVLTKINKSCVFILGILSNFAPHIGVMHQFSMQLRGKITSPWQFGCIY